MSQTKTKRAGTAVSRVSGAAATGTTLARDRAREAADLAREAASQVAPRARDVATQVAPLGRRAGMTAAQGVHDAREWAAPLLENAADAVTGTVAPTVSTALKETARRVDPGPSRKRGLLGWPGALVLAVLAAAGAAAAAVLLRKRQPPSPPPFPEEEAGEGSTSSAQLDTEAGNGRVHQS